MSLMKFRSMTLFKAQRITADKIRHPLGGGWSFWPSPPQEAADADLSPSSSINQRFASLFALFLTETRDGSVLDEVDAPLDDYNVERFYDLLKAMRKRATPLVAITHNPNHPSRAWTAVRVAIADAVSPLVSVERRRRGGSPRGGGQHLTNLDDSSRLGDG